METFLLRPHSPAREIMKSMTITPIRRIAIAATMLVLFGAGIVVGANKYRKEKSIVHVVTLYWADGVTDAQKQKALEGVEGMAKTIPGLTSVWLKSVKVQGQIDGHNVQNAFVMEFKDEAALKAYADHPAHKAWEEEYTKVRGESRTFDITNE
jgi:hypothetical protein